MFSARMPRRESVDVTPPTLAQIVELIERLRASNAGDRRIVRLLEDLGPYLPAGFDPAAIDQQLAALSGEAVAPTDAPRADQGRSDDG